MILQVYIINIYYKFFFLPLASLPINNSYHFHSAKELLFLKGLIPLKKILLAQNRLPLFRSELPIHPGQLHDV